VRPRGWLLLLCVFLLSWEPLKLAGEFSAAAGTFSMRGPLAPVELTAHAAVAMLSVAAGWGLWIGNPRAPRFAAGAVAGSAIVTVQSLYWSVLPGNVMPGDRLPLALVALAHAAAWLAYLRRSRQVRVSYAVEPAVVTRTIFPM
jgi:hypothetical protein